MAMTAGVITRAFSALLDVALPRHCAVTGEPLPPGQDIPVSVHILRAVSLTGPDYCKRCGAPQGEGVGEVKECQACRNVTRGFGTREIVAAGRYSDELAEICLAFKFGGERKLARVLASWLHGVLMEREIPGRVDCVVPVPLSALRRLRRGYNQAEELARALAKLLDLPCVDALRRMRDTPRQALLSPAQRRANVRDVFAARPGAGLKGARVLLVDDVLTTGATMHAAARTLKRAGAKAVYGAVAARSTGDDS
jgi:ComF family protein